MRRAAAAVVAFALAAGLLAGAARADFGDPQKRRTAADNARARAILPKLSDFPAGWKAKRAGDSSSNGFDCKGFRPDLSDLVETGYAETPDLSKGDQNLVSAFAAVFRTRGEARTAYSRVVRPALARCLKVLFEKESTKELRVKVLSVRQARVTSVRSRADAYRIVARFSGSGVNLPAHMDFVFFQGGRAVAGTLVMHFPQAIDPKLESRVIDAIDARISRA